MNTILLRHVNIVDSAEGVRREKNVLIEDGKIKSIFGNSGNVSRGSRFRPRRKISGSRLIDMHVHMTAEAGKDKSGMSGGIWRICISVAAESDALSAQRKKSHDVGLYHFEKLRPYHLLHA